jgi:hypothetical protein
LLWTSGSPCQKVFKIGRGISCPSFELSQQINKVESIGFLPEMLKKRKKVGRNKTLN